MIHGILRGIDAYWDSDKKNTSFRVQCHRINSFSYVSMMKLDLSWVDIIIE